MAAVTSLKLEEAANTAAEYVASLESLPGEVQHILTEIRHLDKRCTSLQTDIAKTQSKYIKHSLRNAVGRYPAYPSGGVTGGPVSSSGSETPGGNNTKAHLPGRIAAAYAEIDRLSNEKIQLAKHLVEILTRTQTRLDSDVAKVKTLQGESADYTCTPGSFSLTVPYTDRKIEASISNGLHAARQIGENLHSALNGTFGSAESPRASTPPASAMTQHGNKKRRLNAQPSVKRRASTPAATPLVSSRSRGARQVSKYLEPEPEAEDVEAEGEGGEEEFEDGDEDQNLYCFCQKQSYGDMIGCDNPDCPYQWFHISCVGVKTPLPDKWYCPECLKQRSGPDRRKGRKKL
ncbi:hypothetical protein FA15DRAFT_755443 [Coprinopsis marcescibilis]|uniref:Chromatin modification-related protein n=1 Tax=Coprinopsis marcescibilis TaxID=230819 RepID=A0A5C3L1K2_COPMA|nr:hypothetical protein FA15DRAFT_755443 [Coprinopsis marcescibilis]